MTPFADVKISDYDYPLPEDRIAKFPLERRDRSRLLVYRGGRISENRFSELLSELPADALLVFNDTKVVRARIIMHKPEGARIEIFCLEPYDPADYERAFAAKGTSRWKCMIGNLKRWKNGPLELGFRYEGCDCRMTAFRENSAGDTHTVRFEWDAPLAFGAMLEHLGRIPIPPYLGRDSEEIDNTRYQTVYSRVEGSVAAPTAGLHFSTELLEKLHAAGTETAAVTLHVGAGTFLPVKENEAVRHAMHTERFSVGRSLLTALIRHPDSTIPVGTTSVRTLESLPALGYRIMRRGNPDAGLPVGQWEPYELPDKVRTDDALYALLAYMDSLGLDRLEASTRIMIMPGFRYRIASGMITNFHQPKSTLLLLVSAFAGDDWKRIYAYALREGFRFLSYGDSSLLLRG